MSTDLERLTQEWIGPLLMGVAIAMRSTGASLRGRTLSMLRAAKAIERALLAQRARPQAGVDVEEDTIRHATKKHQCNKRLKYKVVASESSPINRVS